MKKHSFCQRFQIGIMANELTYKKTPYAIMIRWAEKQMELAKLVIKKCHFIELQTQVEEDEARIQESKRIVRGQ